MEGRRQTVLTLFEDSRQQKGKHKNIEAYCRNNGIRLVRKALNVGDYQIAGKGDISVDTKMGIPELASNCFQEHERFRDECQRAKDFGIRLIVLIEEVPPDGKLENWRTPMDRYGRPKYKFDPGRLAKVVQTMEERYQVRFRFCDGRSTGKLLIEYLKGERQ